MQSNDTSQAHPRITRRKADRDAVCERCSIRFTPKHGSRGRFCGTDCYQTWWRETGQKEASERGLRKLERLKAEGRDPRATEQTTYKRRMAFRNSALMLAEAGDEGSDDEAWAERGTYWQEIADPPEGIPSLWARRPEPEPLVLTGHGVRLRINHGALEVRHGFTHYPQKARTQMFFPGDVRMPSRIVLIAVDGAITFDVIEFLSRQDVPLVVLDWRGRVVTTFGGKPHALDLKIRQAQIAAQHDGTGLRISIDLIRQKLGGSVQTLRSLPRTPRVESGIERLRDTLEELRRDPPPSIEALRMLEARGAVAYFASWLDVPVRWRGTGRRPIPPEWQRMPLRSSLLGDRNRNATHPVMAALNYAFGVLESQVRTAALRAGLDPTVGYLHASRPGRPALVFDLMEPLRPIAERGLLDLVRSHTLSSGDVYLTERGVCRLHPQLARTLAGIAIDGEVVGTAADRVRAALLPAL